MTDSRVIDFQLDYYAPDTLTEALHIMGSEKVKPMAGGTDLMNNIKMDGLRPDGVIYLMGIKELDYLKAEKGLQIGAGKRLIDIERDKAVISTYPALVKAVNVIGGKQIRNMATLAGNICNSSPGADTVPVLIALGSRVIISSLNKSGAVENRTLPLEDFFTGPKRNIVKENELVTAVEVDQPAKGSGQSFQRLARVRLDIAKINCAVYLVRNGSTVESVRIGFGSVAPTPVRALNTEKYLTGKEWSKHLFAHAAAEIQKDISPIDDVRSTASYRRKTAELLLQQALEEAWERTGAQV